MGACVSEADRCRLFIVGIGLERLLMKYMEAFLTIALNAAIATAEDGRLSLECNLHDESQVSSAMARFRGEDFDAEYRSSVQAYLSAQEEGVLSEAHAHYCIAWIQSGAGLYEKALVSLNKAIESGDPRLEPLFLRAMVFSDLDRCDEAERDFQGAEQAGAEGWGFYLNWADSALSCGNPRAAIDHLERASTFFSKPNDYPTPLLFSFSKTYFKLQEFDRSFSFAQEALRSLAPIRNLCRPEDDFCSSPGLIEAVDLATRSLCAASRIEEAAAVYDQYRMYQFPAPELPDCLSSER